LTQVIAAMSGVRDTPGYRIPKYAPVKSQSPGDQGHQRIVRIELARGEYRLGHERGPLVIDQQSEKNVVGCVQPDGELEDLPRFRRFGGDYTAFVEGWALYAEYLGKELGMFTDPYQWFGRLNDEQLRAMRLVVDTGLHAKGWTREQAIEFMKENTGLSEQNIVSEVDRYIAWPGQALAYKIGQMEISKLRAEAEAALGDRFDIRAFHDHLLEEGSLPLSMLAERMHAWIALQ